MSSNSHCNVVARVPVINVNTPLRNRLEIETQLVLLDGDLAYNATLYAYHEQSLQVDVLIEVRAAFANNGGPSVVLSADMRNIEELGTRPPSHPKYLQSCPPIVAPKFDVIGVVGGITNVDGNKSFTLSGSSYVNGNNMPFTVRIQVDTESKRWARFVMPQNGAHVYVYGPLLRREEEDRGLFVIDMREITYLPSSARSTGNSPLKRKPSSTATGSSWVKARVSPKKRKVNADSSDDDTATLKGDTNIGELPSEGAPVASGSGGRSMQGDEAERGSDRRHRGDFPSMTLRSESEGKRRGKGQNETPDV